VSPFISLVIKHKKPQEITRGFLKTSVRIIKTNKRKSIFSFIQ